MVFDARVFRLAVIDQPGGPGSRYLDAAAVAKATGALLACNGGFFTPEGLPLGVVVTNGARFGDWNASSSLGAGLWCADPLGEQAIRPRQQFPRREVARLRDCLQAGPMLVHQGQPVPRLNTTKSARRTLLVWDGQHRWWIGQTSACTLDQLARWLQQSPPTPWPVHEALNLDGGSSCDLWVAATVPGGPVQQRGWLAKPVRNFLVLLPR